MSIPYTWILGADDAEMRAIESLLRECGQRVVFALTADARRVAPGQRGTTYTNAPEQLPADLLAVEVAGPWGAPAIDHHGEAERASWGPERFLAASSLGQVIERLARMGALPASWERRSTDLLRDGFGGRVVVPGLLLAPSVGGRGTQSWFVCTARNQLAVIPPVLVFEAASDHCLAAAFAGACHGIDPTPGGAFWRHVVETRRATFAPELTDSEFGAILSTSLETLRKAPPAIDLLTMPEDPANNGFTPRCDAPGPDRWVTPNEPIRDPLPWERCAPTCPEPVVVVRGCAWRYPSEWAAVRDLTHLTIDGPVVAATGEQYPSAFQFGPLVGSMAGLGYLVRIRRRDGRIAYRLGGCGEGTAAGPEPVRRWLTGAGEARGCLPATAAPPDNLYGVPARGFGGGTLS